jgi:hypothetical protein
MTLPNPVIPTGADYRASGGLRSGGTLRFMFAPIDRWPIQARFWLEWGCPHLPNSVIPTGADYRER